MLAVRWSSVACRRFAVGFLTAQEISTLRVELARLRHEAERDRRAKTAAEMDREKAASLGREERRELERNLADVKVGVVTSSFGVKPFLVLP